MQSPISYGSQQDDRSRRPKPLIGLLGGVLYVIAALALMQVVFRIWIGMW